MTEVAEASAARGAGRGSQAGDRLAKADPCGGHDCDRCARCRQGRCCRRDQPGYRLPELGEWKPIYGELGVLAVDVDDQRVQCHACGKLFQTLNSHIQRVHELTGEEYRAAFGLNRGTPLAAPVYRGRMRAHGRRVLAPYWPLVAAVARSQTPEQRGVRRRLQTLRDPRFKAAQQRAGQRSAALNHERFLAGTWQPPRPRNASAAGRAGQRRRQELGQDPAYRGWLSRRLSEGQGGRVPVACAACGTVFEVRRALARPGARRYCSRGCLCVAQQESGRETLLRRVSRVCAVCGTTFTGTVRRLYCSRACKKLADHRGASRVCPVCGQAFAVARRQRYCSRACAARARSANRPGARGVGYAAIADRLCALPPAAFASLTEAERQAVGLYYGLDGGERVTQTALEQRLGLRRQPVRSLLVSAVAQLLGPEAVGSTVRVCTACGGTFTPADRWSKQRTCGLACQLERRRQTGRATSPAIRADIRGQLSAGARRRGRPDRERLRALGPAAFAALPDDVRRLVRLYYGLDTDDLPSVQELTARLGLTEWQIRRRLVRATARLLGEPVMEAGGEIVPC